MILRRLVAQGRLGVKSGQGFYPHAHPEAGWEDSPVKLERIGRTAIAWLDRPPANSISPEVVEALRRLWDEVNGSDNIRVLVIASANPMLFCAGADIKSFTKIDAEGGEELADQVHGLLRDMERSLDRHDRRRQRDRVRRRLRAGDGLRHPDRRANRRASGSPRSTSGSSPDSVARRGCRA